MSTNRNDLVQKISEAKLVYNHELGKREDLNKTYQEMMARLDDLEDEIAASQHNVEAAALQLSRCQAALYAYEKREQKRTAPIYDVSASLVLRDTPHSKEKLEVMSSLEAAFDSEDNTLSEEWEAMMNCDLVGIHFEINVKVYKTEDGNE